MKRNVGYKLHSVPAVASPVVLPEYEVQDDDLQRVLKEIFSVDPVSGLPKGDIAYFLSKDGNPQVKAWLESNLLQPRMSSGSTIDGLTDDMIAEMSRGASESVAEYRQRLMSIYDEAVKASQLPKESKE